MIDRIVAGFREPIHCDDVPIDTRIGIGLKALGRAGGSPGEDLRAALSAAQDSRSSRKRLVVVRPQDATRRTAGRSGCLSDLKHALDSEGQLELHYQPKVDPRHRRLRQRRGAAALDASRARAGLARRVRAARRDHGAGHADDALGDRRRDPAGGDLAARRAGPDHCGECLAEEPRGAGLRRIPAVLLRGARAGPCPDRARGDRGGQCGTRRADPRPAGGFAASWASRSRSTTSGRAIPT